MDRSLFRRLETGYRLSKAALVVEISRSQSCFVVESDLATTQLQTAITGNRTHYAHLASYVYSILANVVLNMAVSGLINLAFKTLIRPGFVRTLGNHSIS
jgi:hypothetical protein